MTKKLNKILITATILVLVLSSIAMFLLVPRKPSGKADEIWYGAESFNINNIESLVKEESKDFNILALTDIQFDNPFKSKKEIKQDLKELVEETNPDLIVTVGDNFAGIFNHFHIDSFIKLMDGLGKPWAPVFGNHERDFGADLIYLAQQMQKSKLCLFKTGADNIDGVGNYFLNIVENQNVAFSLVMMDCNEEVIVKNAKGKRVDAYYESPRHSQVQWYKDNIIGINQASGKTVPNILFTHTPLPEFKTAYNLYKEGSNDVNYITGEGEVDGGKINYGLFDTALELQSTKHMFFGHEHTNTIALEYKGINLAFTVKTGNFSSYNEGKIGATHIVLKNNGVIEYNQKYNK